LGNTRKHIIQFAWRAIALLVGWMVLNQLVLRPHQITELWLAPELARITANLLRMGYDHVWLHGPILGLNTTNGIHIVEGCVGLDYYAMFLGFLLAFPGRKSWRHQLSFALFGLGTLYLTNIIRLLSLALVQYYAPNLLESWHYWTGSYLFFGLVMLLWMIYVHEVPVTSEIGSGE
jgi:exosortase/archaeosortase family protein